jgi:hypothetical protein
MKCKITDSAGKYSLFLQYSYLQTVLISVFTVFGTFSIVAKSVLVFICFVLFCFVLIVAGPAHILRLTVASG